MFLLLGSRVGLTEVARALPRSIYEPEQFPRLICRIRGPRATVLVFSSGRLICMGAKSELDVYRAINNFRKALALPPYAL